LKSTDTLPEDEDELSYFLEDMNLPWDLYIPIYEEKLVSQTV